MPEAWMVRSAQQQRLIEKLVRKFRDKAEEIIEEISDEEEVNGDMFAFDLLVVMALDFGEEVVRNGRLHDDERQLAIDFYREYVLAPIIDFARVEVEKEVLLWRFFLTIAESLKGKSDSKLRRVELSQPQEIFHAPSAMAELNLDASDADE